jgi:hypothetical protein
MMAVIDIKIHRELNATNVGKSFFMEAQINKEDVTPLIIKNHHT